MMAVFAMSWIATANMSTFFSFCERKGRMMDHPVATRRVTTT
jgi:hypothetical protein